jgi:hypothetical protein
LTIELDELREMQAPRPKPKLARQKAKA